MILHTLDAYFQVVCPDFQVFCPDFHGFCLDFRQIKTFGGEVAVPAPPLPTPLALGVFIPAMSNRNARLG